MKKLFLIALLSWLSSSLFAQNWFPVNRNGVNYYEEMGNNGSRRIFSGYITDSAIIGNDKFYTTQKNLQQTSAPLGCEISNNYSWFGKKMKVIHDTCALFYDVSDFPFVLFTNTTIGKSWLAFANKNTRYTLTHTKTEVMNILGEPDSVKTFTIIAKDTTGKVIKDYHYSSFPIQLSKRFGLVKTVNFFSFGDDDPNTFEFVPRMFELKGNSTISTGIKNITMDDVFDMNIGDILHQLEFNTSLIAIPMNPIFTADTNKIILQVIDRTTSVDSFFFTFARRNAFTSLKNKISSSSLTIDTITKAYSRVAFRFLNNEPGLPEDSVSFYGPQSVFIGYNSHLEYKKTFHHYYLRKQNDTCLHFIIDATSPTFTFIKGAGPYNEYGAGNSWDWSSHGTRLVYYKKGTQTWGKPWPENVGIRETPMNEMKTRLYPNPFKNMLTLMNDNNYPLTLKLYSIKGELLIQQTIPPGETIVNTENLALGLYFYSILGDGTIVNQKLVKE